MHKTKLYLNKSIFKIEKNECKLVKKNLSFLNSHLKTGQGIISIKICFLKHVQ